jgi:hypothetical protein
MECPVKMVLAGDVDSEAPAESLSTSVTWYVPGLA